MKEKLTNKNIQDFYNSKIEDRYENDYEFNRWFKNSRLRLDYYMVYKSIKHHLKDVDFNNCLELGPGPGTWTKLLYKKNPNANFDLVDISKSMKGQFMGEMRRQPNTNYVVGDINEYNFDKQYDLFFSSRAIEYLDNKQLLLEKVFRVLVKGGQGMIITKNPNIGLFNRKKTTRWQHSGQISIKKLQDKLKDTGFKNIKVYPVIIRLPIFDRLKFSWSEKLFEKVFRYRLSNKLLPFVESYIIIFEK